jgi:hypothetical protein
MSSENPYAGPPQKVAAMSATLSAAPTELETNKDAKMWAMFAHLSPIILSFVGVGFFGGSFLGPLVIWLIKKDEFPFVADQAKESLNFQLTMLIALVVGWAITGMTCFMVPVVLVVPILQLVFGIIATIKSNNGEWYRYPLTIRMVT